eukprot:SAG22_NODE_3815_length_1518_cov_1.424947_1_plen_98_part_00
MGPLEGSLAAPAFHGSAETKLHYQSTTTAGNLSALLRSAGIVAAETEVCTPPDDDWVALKKFSVLAMEWPRVVMFCRSATFLADDENSVDTSSKDES